MGMSNQTEEKELFHAVSLSGGKDSTAMLLLMIERGLPIQAVLTADTGMEFPEMYEHLQKLNDYLFAERGLHLTWLRHPKGFEWLMFEEKKQRPASIENRQRLGVSLYGNGWPGPRVRWCTGQLKTHLIHKEINRLKGQYRAVSYVTAEEFLSGNVRKKLRMLQALQAALPAEKKDALAGYLSAMEAVQPTELTAAEIGVRIGASWVPMKI